MSLDVSNMFSDEYEIMLSCKSKKSYDNEYYAKFAADEQMQYHPGLKLDWYKCKYCGKWHLTKKQN